MLDCGEMWSNDSKKKDDDIESPPDGDEGLSSIGDYSIMQTDEPPSGLNGGLRNRLNRRKSQMVNVEQTLLSQDIHDRNHFSLTKMESSVGRFFRDAHAQDEISNSTGGDSDTENLHSYVQKMIDNEFPKKDQIPTCSQLLNFGKLHANRSMYAPGDWVEIEGHDMIWRLDMITRVIKTAPDNWDWNDPVNEDKEPKWTFTYNAGAERNVEAYDLRTPENGLKILFGTRPWVWQQYAILKLEKKLRFQKGHQDDFEEFDIQKYSAGLWERWLEHPSNSEFREVYYDNRIGEKGRALLANHIQKPFNLIDTMGEENKEWNFKEDENINVFTYLSMFGSGISLPMLVLAVQIVVPLLLTREAYAKANNGCADGDELSQSDILAEAMSIVIFAYYLFSIIPDTYANFFNVAGAADSVYSRLLSIRRGLWLQGDDSMLQMFGYKLDIYMNTSYETLLSMLNIYVILNTDEAIEIVLNALAFTFIARIDEDLTKSGWYDPEKRWATSGAMTISMQKVLNFRALGSRSLFSREFNISEDLLMEVDDGSKCFLKDRRLANLDEYDPQYMSNTEKIELICSNIAVDSSNRNALDEYNKPRRYFGALEKLFSCFGTYPIFGRFKDYQTWSKWERILFLAPVPDLNAIFTAADENGLVSVSPELEEIKLPYNNFYPEDDDKEETAMFIRHFIDVLLFRDLLRALEPGLYIGYASMIFRFIDGIFFNWWSYFVHILFPIYLLFGFLEVFYNVITGLCFHPIDDASNFVIDWIKGLIQ